MRPSFLSFAIFFLLLISSASIFAQNSEKKVLLQGFWWDYKNENYPNGWANYLTDLAPRLKNMGIDAIWIPPSVKNLAFGEPGVGYAPFDHYDLGDKYQKGSVNTRLGTKDELLRMIAVLHANGIDVIQDIVPNHLIGAGSNTGAGGQDPLSTNDKYTNFRYVCYKTPGISESEQNYLSREGRFPKNYQNFHPNPAHNCNAGDLCAQFFGPDICYADNAQGLSSNAIYNPPQSGTANNSYMRREVRNWLIWYKKQTGFDGLRIDAVKHFDVKAAEDFLYNVTQNAGFASGGDGMFAVGEFVGNSSEMENWYQAVNKRAGVFDFSLRAFDGSGGLYKMVYGMGNFDLSVLPGAQQGESSRKQHYASINSTIHKTVPFVNNHDTFRPILDEKGNYIGWQSNSELSPHIEPKEPRLIPAYAVIFAMDGNPQVFFEDLFNIGYNGNRFNHFPFDEKLLPANPDLVNLMLCHRQLDFKSGAYRVRSQEKGVYFTQGSAQDHLVIERLGKAVIGINDSWDTWQNAWIDSGFSPGTKLMDYSGANGMDVKTVQPDRRVNINTPPVNPDLNISKRHGYSVWAPVPNNVPFKSLADMQKYLSGVKPGKNPVTVQEWEMADDLGDSNCLSLGQGGALPPNSTNYRIAGKIFAEKGKSVKCEVFPSDNSKEILLSLFDLEGNPLKFAEGRGEITLTYIPEKTGWITLKLRNTSKNHSGQKCFVKATYTAPANVKTIEYDARIQTCFWTGNGGNSDWRDCNNWEEGKVPVFSSSIVIAGGTDFFPKLPVSFGKVVNLNRSN